MKSGKILIFAALLAASFLTACSQDGKPPAANNTTPAPSVDKSEVYLYVTTVDRLNLRDQPNKNGQVITRLAEGEFVEGTGEVSSNKEEVMLRDVMYLEPYIKVTKEQNTGWAYGGALQCVYTGTRTGIPDLEKLSQLTGHLKSLDTKKLGSGKKAWEYVTANFSDAKGPLADAAFILLETFMFRMEREGEYYTLTDRVQWSNEDYKAIDDHKFDLNKNSVTKSLAESGFELSVGEGMVFPIVDWNRLQAFFVPKVTPAMKTFIEQETAEHNKPAWSDGGIIIPMEELADRGAYWEKFNQANPNFPLKEQTKESERWTRVVLITGADNSPVSDYETLKITDEFKNVWNYIQQKYPGTRLANDAKKISTLCAAEGWKRTKKVEDWQTEFAAEN